MSAPTETAVAPAAEVKPEEIVAPATEATPEAEPTKVDEPAPVCILLSQDLLSFFAYSVR